MTGGSGKVVRYETGATSSCTCLLGRGQLWSGYTGSRLLTAFALGGATTIVSGPTFSGSGLFRAYWTCYDLSSGGNQGDHELEHRSWFSWLVPLHTTYVRVTGTATAEHLVTDAETFGSPQTTTVAYEMGTVTIDPDNPPTVWDNTGTGLNGSTPFLSNYPTTGLGSAGQTTTAIDLTSANLGPVYTDTLGAIGPAGTQYRLFQLSVKNVSTHGLGRHSGAGGGPHDYESIEVLDRFPNNPDWQHGFTGPGFYTDYSQTESAVTLDLKITAYGPTPVTDGSCTLDDFEDRTVAATWGDASTGLPWGYPGGIPAGTTLSVAGGVGIVQMANNDTPQLSQGLPGLWTGADGFILIVDFLTGAIPGIGSYVIVDLYDDDFRFEFDARISSDPAFGEVAIWDGAAFPALVKTDWLPATWYRAKAEYRPGMLVRVKVWERAGSEPGWQVESAAAGAALTTPLNISPGNFSGGTYALKFDSVKFGCDATDAPAPVLIYGR